MRKMKKLISVLCAIALVVTSFAGLTFTMAETEVQAAEETSDVQYDEKIVEKTWVNEDFEKAATVTLNYHEQNDANDNQKKYRGEMHPVSTTDKNGVSTKALRYIQGTYGYGYVYLGDACTDLTTIPSEGLVQVEAGATYEVSFDFMLDVGQTTHKGTEEEKSYTELNSELDVGLLLMPESTAIPDSSNKPQKEIITENSTKMNCITVAKGTTEDIAWERKTFTYTVPQDADLTTYKYLGLYTNGGQCGAVYLDNIQVTQLRKETSKLVSYNDYSEATIRSSIYSVQSAMADCYPTYDPKTNFNSVIYYKQTTGQGYVVLGSECSGNASAIAEEAITAEAGKTYTITFDYLAQGTPTADTQVCLCVGTASGGRVGDGTSTNQTRTLSYTSDAILTLAKGTDYSESTWQRDYSAQVTIPEGTSLDKGDKLLLEFTGGGTKGGQLYIDNVKVTVDTTNESLITDDADYFADFEDVTALGFKDDGSVNYNSGGYQTTSGDISPQADPLDAENMTLWLPKSRTTHHVIVLGSSYASTDENTIRNSAIVPVKGTDYQIGFDWYHKQTTTDSTRSVKIYAAVGRLVYEKREEDTSKKYHWDQSWETELLSIPVQDPTTTSWQNFETTVTIPSDINIPDGYSLVLYIYAPVNYAKGTGSLVCFDNISCKSTSPMSAQITVGSDYSSKIYDKTTFDLATLYPTDEENQKTVKWYTNKNRTEAFDCNVEKENLPIHLELYGEYERADAAFAIGDTNNNGKVENEDVSEIRKYLVGNTALISSEEKADTNGDGAISLKDIVRTKKSINASISGYKLSYGEGVSEANQTLAVSYLGESVDSAAYTITFNQTSDMEGYSIYKDENTFTVNAKDDYNLTAAIMSLKSYLASGRDLKEGCLTAFQYTGTVKPSEVEGDKTLEMRLAWANEQLENEQIDGEYYLYFTDPHLITSGTGTEDATKKASLQTLSRLFNTYNPSFALCGGDWLNNHHSKEDAKKALGQIRTDMTTLFGEKSYLVVGNHDYNYQHTSSTTTSRENDELTANEIAAAWSSTENKTYYSFATEKSRFYVFDSGIDWDHASLSSLDEEQIVWFLEQLKNSDDQHIVLAPHMVYMDDALTSVHVATETYAEISAAYNARTSYTYNEKNYDFSTKTGQVEYMIAGHKHVDYVSELSGIPVVLTHTMKDVVDGIPSSNFVFANYTEGKLYIVGTGASTDRVIDLSRCSHTYESLLSACTNCGETRTSVKILAVGNSFSEDATYYLGDLLQNAGVQNVTVANAYVGNCPMYQHYEYASNNTAAYTYQKTTKGYSNWTENENNTLATILADEDWDAVIMQERSFNAGGKGANSYTKFEELYNYIKENVPKTAQFYWQMTWAFPEHDPDGLRYLANTSNKDHTHAATTESLSTATEHYTFHLYDCSQTQMYNDICSATQTNVSVKDWFAGIIPTGTSIQNLRTSSLGDSLNRDNCHLNYKEGRYTAALTWIATFGGNVNNITWTPSAQTTVATNLSAIKEAVTNAITTPYAVIQSTYTASEE